MATKLYLRDTNSVVPYLPATYQTSNTLTRSAIYMQLSLLASAGSSTQSLPELGGTSGATMISAVGRDGYNEQAIFVSNPFDGASTIIGGQTWTFAFMGQEYDKKQNCYFRVCLYVWRPRTQTVVKSIIDTTTNQGNELTTTLQGRVFTVGGGATDFTPQKGDVLVLEPLWSWEDVSTNGLTFRYNEATDVTEGGSGGGAYINYGGSNTLGFTTTEELDITHFRFHEDDSTAGNTLPTGFKSIDEDKVPVIDFTADRKIRCRLQVRCTGVGLPNTSDFRPFYKLGTGSWQEINTEASGTEVFYTASSNITDDADTALSDVNALSALAGDVAYLTDNNGWLEADPTGLFDNGLATGNYADVEFCFSLDYADSDITDGLEVFFKVDTGTTGVLKTTPTIWPKLIVEKTAASLTQSAYRFRGDTTNPTTELYAASQLSDDAYTNSYGGGNIKHAQLFSGNGGKLVRLSLWLYKSGSPTGVLITPVLWNDSSGSPGSVVAYGTPFYCDTLTTSTSGREEFLSFPSLPTLTSGTNNLWIGFEISGGSSDLTNYIGIRRYSSASNWKYYVSSWSSGAGGLKFVVTCAPDILTWDAALNTQLSDVNVDSGNVTKRCRIAVKNTAQSYYNNTLKLKYRKYNGTPSGSFSDIPLAWADTIYDSGGSSEALTVTYQKLGQCFIAGIGTITGVKVYIKKSTGATGQAVSCDLYSSSGSYGSAVPTGSSLATASNTIDTSTLSDSAYTLCTFNFNYSVSSSSPLFFVLTANGYTYQVFFETDNTSPSAYGNMAKYYLSWIVDEDEDLRYEVTYTEEGSSPVTIPYSAYLTQGDNAQQLLTWNTGADEQNSPSSYTDESGDWTGDGNEQVNDMQNMNSPTVSAGSYSSYYRTAGYSLAIPTGAIVTGIKVEITSFGSNYLFELQLYWNGAVRGITRELWSGNVSYTSTGGMLDDWGAGEISETDAERSDFGVRIRYHNDTMGNSAGYLNHIRLTAYYYVPFNLHNHGIINASATTSDSVNLNYTPPAQTVELEFPFTLVAANLNDNDTIEMKVVDSGGNDLTTYSYTPTITIEKAGGTQTGTYAASGGAISGGDVPKNETRTYLAAGGAIGGGEATVQTVQPQTRVETGAGGAICGSSALQARAIAQAATSGGISGSTATCSRIVAQIATSGGISGSSATCAVTKSWTASDGSLAGSSATFSRTSVFVAVSGSISGGAADVQTNQPQVRTETGAGGSIAGSSALSSRTVAQSASGGSIAGSAATASFAVAISASAGALAGSLASVSAIAAIQSSGGALAGSAAVVVRTVAVTSAAGAIAGSAASQSLVSARLAAGGALAGSAASQARGIAQAAAGGAIAGSAATVSSVVALAASAGALAGSSATLARTAVAVAAAGSLAGGAADVQTTANQVRSEEGSGGSIAGSSATLQRVAASAASGGAISGASAQITALAVSQASGGSLAGGAATHSRTISQQPVAGALAGSQATVAKIAAIAASGGAVSGASPLVSAVRVAVSLAGALSGGAADYSTTGLQVLDVTGSGGAVSGSTASVLAVVSSFAAGGSVAAGSPVSSSSFSPLASGGALGGGAALLTRSVSWVAAAGALAGSAATLSCVRTHVAADGALAGGQPVASRAASFQATLGGLAGGQATATRVCSITGTDGALAGGVALRNAVQVPVGLGGAISGGVAEIQTTGGYAYVAVGGSLAGGQAIATVAQSVQAIGGGISGAVIDFAFGLAQQALGGGVLAGQATQSKGFETAAIGGGIAGTLVPMRISSQGTESEGLSCVTNQGDMLIAVTAWATSDADVTVSDDRGGTWIRLSRANTGTSFLQVHYCLSHPGGSTTVSVAWGASQMTGWSLHQYRGVSAFEVEAHASASGSGTAFSTGSANVIRGDTLLVAAVADSSSDSDVSWDNFTELVEV